ncbi:MAG: hemolysin III family protein [Tenericutes bacterium]|nr:hemolysin III family protein [Mycoplasmatota bacterium]
MKKTSVGEMIANAISHGVGLLLAINALVLLLLKANTTAEVLSSIIFGLSMIMLYASSTLFHSFPEKMKKTYTVFQRLDHSSIFLLIAGTYTPFLILVVNNTKGYILLGFIWAMTITGIVFKSIWIKKFKFFHLAMYLLMGWSVLIVKDDFFLNIDNYLFVLIGGLSYTIGVIFYVAKFKYSHFVWHIFVLAGTFFHFLAVYSVIL